MHGDGHAGRSKIACQGGNLVLMGMDAARRHQPRDMRRAAARFQLIDKRDQTVMIGERAVIYGGVDAWQVLQHDPTRAEVHVSDL